MGYPKHFSSNWFSAITLTSARWKQINTPSYLNILGHFLQILVYSDKQKIPQCWYIMRSYHSYFEIRLHIHQCLEKKRKVVLKSSINRWFQKPKEMDVRVPFELLKSLNSKETVSFYLKQLSRRTDEFWNTTRKKNFFRMVPAQLSSPMYPSLQTHSGTPA